MKVKKMRFIPSRDTRRLKEKLMVLYLLTKTDNFSYLVFSAVAPNYNKNLIKFGIFFSIFQLFSQFLFFRSCTELLQWILKECDYRALNRNDLLECYLYRRLYAFFSSSFLKLFITRHMCFVLLEEIKSQLHTKNAKFQYLWYDVQFYNHYF